MDGEPVTTVKKELSGGEIIAEFRSGEHLGMQIGDTVIADLPLLETNGIGTSFEPSDTINNSPFWEIKLTAAYEQDSINRTDWDKVQKFIDSYLENNPDIANKYPDYLQNPIAAAQLASKITQDSFTYYDYLVFDKPPEPESEQQEEIDRINNLSLDELLEEGYGVCRHMSFAASGIYERFKQISGQALDNTFLIPILNGEFTTDYNGGHSYNLFAAIGKKNTYLAISDPTHDQTREENETGLYTNSRLPALIEFLINNQSSFLSPELAKPDIINQIIQTELDIIKNRIDFNNPGSIDIILSSTGISLNSGKSYIRLIGGLFHAQEQVNNPAQETQVSTARAFDHTVEYVLEHTQGSPYQKDFVAELIQYANYFNPDTLLKLVDLYQKIPGNKDRRQSKKVKQALMTINSDIEMFHSSGVFFGRPSIIDEEYTDLYQKINKFVATKKTKT